MEHLERSLALLLREEPEESETETKELTPAEWLGPEPEDYSEYAAALEEKVASTSSLSTTALSDSSQGLGASCVDEASWDWTSDEQQWGCRERYAPQYAAEGQTWGYDCGYNYQAVKYETVMLRNIPNKYTTHMLVERLYACGYKGAIDFVYMPIDFKNNCNMGYAFLNFRDTWASAKFVEEFHLSDSSVTLPGFRSKKVCEVSPASCQGCHENVKRLLASPVMEQLAKRPECMPKLFDEYGEETEFPMPDFAPSRHGPQQPFRPKRAAGRNGIKKAAKNAQWSLSQHAEWSPVIIST